MLPLGNYLKVANAICTHLCSNIRRNYRQQKLLLMLFLTLQPNPKIKLNVIFINLKNAEIEEPKFY